MKTSTGTINVSIKGEKNSKTSIVLSTILYATGIGRICMIKCRNGDVWYCTTSIKDIVKENPGFGFHLISQKIMININEAPIKFKFNLQTVTMSDLIIHKITRKYREYFMTLCLKKWLGLKQ